MDEATFWHIVQQAHDASAGNMAAKCEAIEAQLLALPAADVLEFGEHFDRALDKAYDWRLWGAAYVIHGGCSDDTFTDFRASLISRGRRDFELALSDPDALADEPIDEDDWFYEGYQYAISDAVRAKATSPSAQTPQGWFGRLLGRRTSEPQQPMPRYAPAPPEPAGTEWSETDLPNLYPRLSKRFA